MDLDPDPMDPMDLDLDLDPIHPSLTLGARNCHLVKILGFILKRAIVFLIMKITDLDGLYWS